jgi:hypothetical protein
MSDEKKVTESDRIARLRRLMYRHGELGGKLVCRSVVLPIRAWPAPMHLPAMPKVTCPFDSVRTRVRSDQIIANLSIVASLKITERTIFLSQAWAVGDCRPCSVTANFSAHLEADMGSISVFIQPNLQVYHNLKDLKSMIIIAC